MFRPRTSHWTWSAIIFVVLVFLVAMQMLRVNQRRSALLPGAEGVELYIPKGPVVNGTIVIPAGEFYMKRLNLNQRVKLAGSFRTSKLQNLVNTLVIDEKHFEDWMAGRDISTLARTGHVPGGKINLILQPGVYLLLIDNRQNAEARSVSADFFLE